MKEISILLKLNCLIQENEKKKLNLLIPMHAKLKHVAGNIKVKETSPQSKTGRILKCRKEGVRLLNKAGMNMY